MVIQQFTFSNSCVNLFTGFARRAYFQEVPIPILSCGLGGNGDCKWNNSVSKGRIKDEIKASGTTLSSLSFNELRQITKKTIWEDMKSWFAHKERGAAYVQRYRITEHGLVIMEGIDNGKLFHDVFIDRPRILGPQRDYIPDEQELARLELFEQSVLSGQKNFISATGEGGAYRYVEKWEVQDDGIVVVRGKDIGSVKEDLSETSASKLLQNILGVSKQEALDSEGLLFTVKDKTKMVNVFDKAIEILTEDKSHTSSSVEVRPTRTTPILSDKPLDMSLSHYNVSKHRSGNMTEGVVQSRIQSGMNRTEVSQVVSVIERKFSSLYHLEKQTEGITKKVGHDTKNSLVLLGIWVAEVWRNRKKQQKETEKHKNVSSLTNSPTETLFAHLRKRLFTKKVEAPILKKEKNSLKKQFIKIRHKLIEKVFTLKKASRSIRERVVVGFKKRKREIVTIVSIVLCKMDKHIKTVKRVSEQPNKAIRNGWKIVEKVAVRLKTNRMREVFLSFLSRRALKKERVLQRQHIKERQKMLPTEQIRREQGVFSRPKRLFGELQQNFIVAKDKKKTARLLSINSIFSQVARVRKKIEVQSFGRQIFRFNRLRIVVLGIKNCELFGAFFRQRFLTNKNNEDTKQHKKTIFWKRIEGVSAPRELAKTVVSLPTLKNRPTELSFFPYRFWIWFGKFGLLKIERSVAVKFGQPLQGKPSQKTATCVVYQYRVSPKKGSVVVS